MQFAEFTQKPKQTKISAILSKPHQPFFILGTAIAMIGIVLTYTTMSGFLGGIVYLKTYHVFTISILMPTAFFFGFLFTVTTRFLLLNPFSKKQYMSVFWLFFAGVVLSQIGFFKSITLGALGITAVALAMSIALKHFISVYAKSTVNDKKDVFWIIVAFASGVAATILFCISIFFDFILQTAVNMAFYPFAVGTVFAVAQKMIPNFFSIYFSTALPKKSRFILPTVIFSLFAIAFSNTVELSYFVFVSNFIGAFALSWLFYEYRFIFKKAPPILWILQVGAIWFFAGFLSGISQAIFQNIPNLLQIHIWGVGFIVTMVIGFGSRVAMGHSGRKIIADKITTVIFVGVILLAIFRIAGVFNSVMLDVSAYAWCTIFAIWFLRYANMLLSE